MLKTDFINTVLNLYHVNDTDEPYIMFEIDIMADKALSIHKDSSNWDGVTIADQYPLELLVGSMIHYSRASGSAKTDFPIESQEGSLDKSARYRNNVEMALALKAEYDSIRATSGKSMHISHIGRMNATDGYVHHLGAVPSVEKAVITKAEADDEYIYVDWTAPTNEWAFRRSVVYIGEVDPYDPYSPSLVYKEARASAFVFDLTRQRVRFRLLPPGTYYVRVLRENLNGIREISEPAELIVE